MKQNAFVQTQSQNAPTANKTYCVLNHWILYGGQREEEKKTVQR